jgi:hypothetical protein
MRDHHESDAGRLAIKAPGFMPSTNCAAHRERVQQVETRPKSMSEFVKSVSHDRWP